MSTFLFLMLFLQNGESNSFSFCSAGSVTQYYRSGAHHGGRTPALKRFFAEHYAPPKGVTGQDGYIRIRFVINCEGKTGLFEMLESDFDYQPKKFHPGVAQQLFELTRLIDDWDPGVCGEKRCDSSMFITFKLKEGRIEELLP